MEVRYKGMQMRQGNLQRCTNIVEGYKTLLVWLGKGGARENSPSQFYSIDTPTTFFCFSICPWQKRFTQLKSQSSSSLESTLSILCFFETVVAPKKLPPLPIKQPVRAQCAWMTVEHANQSAVVSEWGWLHVIIVLQPWMSDGDSLSPVFQQRHHTAEIACSPAWSPVSVVWAVIYRGDRELVTVHYYWWNKRQCHRPSILALWCPLHLARGSHLITCLLTQTFGCTPTLTYEV